MLNICWKQPTKIKNRGEKTQGRTGFWAKPIKNDKTKQPITPSFVLLIEYMLKLHVYTLWCDDFM